MVKEVRIKDSVPGITAKAYFARVYGDAKAIQRYHKEVTKDPKAQATAWDNNERQVNFHMALNVPQMLKSVIGVESIQVVENQKLTWKGSNCFSISSQPTLNFPGSQKFVTRGEVTVTESPGGGCQVDAIIFCSTEMPWPLQSTVEAAMAAEAKTSLGKFVDFCKRYCLEATAEEALPVPRHATAIAAEDGEVFFDAEAEEQLAGAPGPLSAVSGASGERALVSARSAVAVSAYARAPGVRAPAEPTGPVDESDMAALQREMVELLRELNSSMQAMAEDISAIREVLTPAAPASGSGWAARWGGRGSGSARTAGVSGAPAPSAVEDEAPASGGRTYGWLVFMSFGLSAASMASVVYMHMQQRKGSSS